jgi:hypothetical protein
MVLALLGIPLYGKTEIEVGKAFIPFYYWFKSNQNKDDLNNFEL